MGVPSERAAALRRACTVVSILACGSCGVFGVCEKEPDRRAAASRPPEPGHRPVAKEPRDAGPAVEWDARGADADDPNARQIVTTGVAAYEKMNIFERPDYASPRIGYARRGTSVTVHGPVAARDCGENGQKWFQLDEGGYVCSGRGLLLGEPLSQFLFAPPPPDFSGPAPYRYAHVRRDRTPLYKRAPTPQERVDVMTFLFPPLEGTDAGATAETDLEDGGEPAGGDEPPVVDDLGDLGEGLPAEQVAGAAEGAGGAGGPDAGVAPPEVVDAGEEAEDAGMSEADRELLQRGPRHAMLTRVLMKGFTVALAASESVEGHLWYRTVDGSYLDSDDVSEIRIQSSLEGIVLTGGVTLPVGIVVGRAARLYSRNDRDEIVATGQLGRFASFAITGSEARGERTLWATADGTYVSQGRTLVVIEKVAPPRAVQAWDKWIVIDLTHQTLTAYEGEIPVFATLVSTGKEGFETPTGVFRILSKHVSNPMDDFTLGEPYAIDEVPYVMYFQQNVALHGAFWHRNFGQVRSHGCVNLSPNDAKWLFDWVGPHLPDGWHGVYSTDASPGTIVWVRKPRS